MLQNLAIILLQVNYSKNNFLVLIPRKTSKRPGRATNNEVCHGLINQRIIFADLIKLPISQTPNRAAAKLKKKTWPRIKTISRIMQNPENRCRSNLNSGPKSRRTTTRRCLLQAAQQVVKDFKTKGFPRKTLQIPGASWA